MEKAKSIAQMISEIDSSYMTEAEKYNAMARAERAEAVMAFCSMIAASTKQAIAKAKDYLVAVSHQGHQA